MLRRVTIVAILCVIGSAALGQSEAERRRAHLPFVRAATDCTARSISSSEAAMGFAAVGRWSDAINSVFEICKPHYLQLVARHDLIYGGGGLDFYKGPYLADLPRALSTRLKNELENRAARVAERERLEKEQAAQRAQAAKAQYDAKLALVREALAAYSDCMDREAAALISFTNENAETLASVSETKCRASRNRLNTVAQVVLNVSASEAQKWADDLAENERKKLVASIVTARAAAAAARSQPSTRPDTVPASPGRTF